MTRSCNNTTYNSQRKDVQTMISKRKGFTLIELLVVIAIIAILAAILFPVFAKARAKAVATKCLSNAKGLTLAELMYAEDYGGRFPTPGTAGVDLAWCLMPYVGNEQAMWCPTYGALPWNTHWYGMESNASAWGHAGNHFPAQPEEYFGASYRWAECGPQAHIQFPAEMLLIIESQSDKLDSSGYAFAYCPFCNNAQPLYDDPYLCAALRHNRGGHHGFADGHVQWLGFGGLHDGAHAWNDATQPWKAELSTSADTKLGATGQTELNALTPEIMRDMLTWGHINWRPNAP